MTIFLLFLSSIIVVLSGYFIVGVWKFISKKDKSYLEMNIKLLVIISMLLGILTLLLRYVYGN